LLPKAYAELMEELRALAELMGKTIDAVEGVTV
jgi:3-deoxy-7-phosphoheptulonate synthase